MNTGVLPSPLPNSAESPQERILVALMALCVLCLRPTVFGERFSMLSITALGLCTAALLVLAVGNRRRLVPEPLAIAQVAITAVISYYLVIRIAIFMPTRDPVDEFKAFFIFMVFSAAVLLIFCYPPYAKRFFDTFAALIVLSSISLSITAILMVAGVPAHQLIIAKLEYTYAGRGDIAFPFTFLYNEVTTALGSAPRLSGVYREPGIFPLISCWAAAYAWRLGWPIWTWMICLFATVACMSSIGPPLALYTAGMLMLMRLGFGPVTALAIVAVGGLLGWQAVYSSEYFDIESKINSGSGSFEERIFLAEGAFHTENLIFGDGFGFSIFQTAPISVVAAVRVFGLIYTAMFIASYVIAAVDFRLWIAGLVPAILGVMLTQPVFREPGFMIIMFSGLVFQGAVDLKPIRWADHRLRRQGSG